MRRSTFSLAALAFVAIAPVAVAQNATTGSKITIGLNSGTTSVDADEIETKQGIGYGLNLGYDVMPALRITAGVDMAKIDLEDGSGDFGLTQFDIGARYSFLQVSPKFQPFVLGSLTQRSMAADVDLGTGDEQELVISGLGYSLGGGVDYAFSSKVSFNGTVKYTMGKFSKAEVDGEEADEFGDIDANGMRLMLGVTFRPFQGR